MGYYFKLAVLFSFADRRSGSCKLSSSTQEEREDLKDALLDTAASAADTAVPRGCLAVYVGPDMRRFVIPTSYLCRPALRALMERAEEEFGFEQVGGLRIPCEEDYFEQVIKALDEEAARSTAQPPATAKKSKGKKERS